MYKTIFMRPSGPNDVTKLLNEMIEEGWCFISSNGNYYIFKELNKDNFKSDNNDYVAARKVFLEWLQPQKGEDISLDEFTRWLDVRYNSQL